MKYDEIFRFRTYESSEVVAKYINAIIADPDIFTNYSRTEVLDLLYELADQQWHNYEVLELTLKKRLENWIINNFDLREFEIVDHLFFIVGSLGLTTIFSKLLEISLEKGVAEKLRFEIIEFSKEVNGDVSDPYSGMNS